MSDIEYWASIGAAALTRPEPAPMCVGDVLYDHDWTPIEAAKAVLEAVDYMGTIETLREKTGTERIAAIEAAIRRTRMARVSAGLSRETTDADHAYAVAAANA
jgi:hypothetical protein